MTTSVKHFASLRPLSEGLDHGRQGRDSPDAHPVRQFRACGRGSGPASAIVPTRQRSTARACGGTGPLRECGRLRVEACSRIPAPGPPASLPPGPVTLRAVLAPTIPRASPCRYACDRRPVNGDAGHLARGRPVADAKVAALNAAGHRRGRARVHAGRTPNRAATGSVSEKSDQTLLHRRTATLPPGGSAE
jgi:hypothetical protein